jgi:hypothetical protein
MTRIRSFAVALTALLALGVAQLAHAQKDVTAPYTGAVTGTVTALDATAKTITVEGPNKDGGVFSVTSDTQVMNDAKAVKFEDLKKGWRVVVSWDYAAVDSKKMVAKLIEVTDAP